MQHTGKDLEFYPLMVAYSKSSQIPISQDFPGKSSSKRNRACLDAVIPDYLFHRQNQLTVMCTPLSPLLSLSSFEWFPGNCNNMDSITACLLLCSIWSPLASSQRGCFWWISNISGVQRACLCISDIVTNYTSLLKAHGCSETPKHSCSNPPEVSYYYGHLDRNILIHAWLEKVTPSLCTKP